MRIYIKYFLFQHFLLTFGFSFVHKKERKEKKKRV